MIETWLLVFLFVYVRNKGVRFLEKNNVYLYKQYNMKKIFNHWSIYLPLLFLIFYIFLEYCMFIRFYYFLPYQHIIKTTTLLSYIPLIVIYRLFENNNPKYINNSLISLLTSPMGKAGICLWVGSTLNKVAMNFNNNLMPTFPSLSYWTKYIDDSGFIDGIHVLGTTHSAAIPLCNIFDCFGYGVLSIGDILIRFYVFLILYYSIKRSQ